MVMPRTDGLSTLKKLKKKEKTQGIPVIIISGKDPDSYLTDVIENYAEHIFAKPVRLTDLNRRIQDLFEISPGRR
jgi:DNA-binding response OmpR family regulator